MADVCIVQLDDWEGLYVDGVCVRQEHRLSVKDVLEALNIDVKYKRPDKEWIESRGHLPRQLSEVKFKENVSTYGKDYNSIGEWLDATKDSTEREVLEVSNE